MLRGSVVKNRFEKRHPHEIHRHIDKPKDIQYNIHFLRKKVI